MEIRNSLLSSTVIWALPACWCLVSIRELRCEVIELPAAVMPWIEVEIPARSPGIIAELKVREGRKVERSEVLAMLDRESEVVEVERSCGELMQFKEQASNDVPVRLANKILEIAMIDLSRAVKARKNLAQSISQAELDHLQLAVARSRLELERAQHQRHLAQIQVGIKESQVALARIALKKRDVLAPYAGVIAEIRHQPGEWVELGHPVFRLLVLDRIRVETLLPASRASRSLIGRQVEFSVSIQNGEQSRFPGKVIFVSPEQDPVNGNVRVWVEVPNRQGRLRPGSRGHVTLEMDNSQVGRDADIRARQAP